MRSDKIVSEVLGDEVTITPSDLYNTDFKAVLMGGYDRQEVDEFLERVGDVFEALLNQVRGYQKENEELQQGIANFREMESTLRNALVSSQKFSENIIDTAKREADALLEQAKLAKARAQHEAAKLSDMLKEEIDALTAERNRLREDLSAILETHAALIKKIPTAEEAKIAAVPPVSAVPPEPEPEETGSEITIERKAWAPKHDDEEDPFP